MRLWSVILILSCTLPSALGQIQKPGLQVPESARKHRDAVEKMFTDSYQAYKLYAFGHDTLAPLNVSYYDELGGFGASVVDSMSTMAIMGLDDLFHEAVQFVATINFNMTKKPTNISLFETTIRQMGGLVSAFELSKKQYPILIQKAKEVADKLTYAFVRGNVIPFGKLNFTTNVPFNESITIAEAGTLALEWSRLSIYTKDEKYGQLAVNALRHIVTMDGPLPGFPAQDINPNTGRAVSKYVTWGAGTDSCLEYLPKYARLTNTNDLTFMDAWQKIVDTSIKYLLKTSIVGNYHYLADWDDGKTIYYGSHLACFHGGNWIFGGKLLNNQKIIDLGLLLNDACWNTYASTATGIGPEVFQFQSADGGGPPPANQSDFNSKHGFWINASDYILRPEVLESNLYAWRVTGNPEFLDRAATTIDNFNKYLLAGVAYAGLYDVNNKNSGSIDYMPSFWLAETLKYLYLTFDDPSHISLDNYVFNTEAHPFEAPPMQYGSGHKAQTEAIHNG